MAEKPTPDELVAAPAGDAPVDPGVAIDQHDLREEIADAFRADERVPGLQAELRSAREQGDRARESTLVDHLRGIRTEAERSVLEAHGLYEDPAEREARREAERLAELNEVQNGLSGSESPTELIAAFGLVDDEGKATIESPLFRDSTRLKFREYLKAVRIFDAASRAEELAGTKVKGAGKASSNRRQMHDAVARLVCDDLGLSFEQARSLAAKVRDGRLPGQGESRVYARNIARQVEEWGGDLGLWSDFIAKDFNADPSERQR